MGTSDGELTLHLIDSAHGRRVQTWNFSDCVEVTIGRGKENNVVVTDPQVSRLHVRLLRRNGGWELESVGLNGTIVDGDEVLERRRLKDGSVFRLGDSGPSFQYEPPQDTSGLTVTLPFLRIHDPALAVQKWLEFAPLPPELTADKKWHVFLSYRYVNRPWVFQLYDALQQAEFEVFVDQFALVPGDSLSRNLEAALERSARGVIVWSDAYEDSEWCRAEYDSMVAMQMDTHSDFRFVTVNLGEQELPPFARRGLNIDFSGSAEGPRGEGLLRLMYGLVGQPLSNAGVKFAQQLDEETSAELAKIAGAREIGDAERLLELGKGTSLPWLASPLPTCATAEALIDMKRLDVAEAVLKRAALQFPKAIRPRQLRALALAEQRKWPLAQQVLSELHAAGHRDPETLGIYARTWMDRYKQTHKTLHLRKSRDLYAEAFKLKPQDYYTGVNAASKSLLLGEVEAGQELAAQVEKLVGAQEVPGDYWKTATAAEVQLIQANYGQAAQLYEIAVLADPEATRKHETTLRQARMLMEKLDTPPLERAKIERVFA